MGIRMRSRSARAVRVLTSVGLVAATVATTGFAARASTPTTATTVPAGISPARGSTTTTPSTRKEPPTTTTPPTTPPATVPPVAPPPPPPSLPAPTPQERRRNAVASAQAQALVAELRATDRRVKRAERLVVAVWRDPLIVRPPQLRRFDVQVVSATLRSQVRAQRAAGEYRDALAMRTLARRVRAAWARTWARSVFSPVYGPSVVSPAKMVAFARAARTRVRTSVPLETLAKLFIEEGEREGVRGDVAWAQSILETGTFSDLIGANNFSGIGGCPTCPHDAFKTARDGVRAQIELLRFHADARIKAPKDFAGQPATLPRRFYTTGHVSPTWYRLGGVWSPEPTYGINVYAIYVRMLDMKMPAAKPQNQTRGPTPAPSAKAPKAVSTP